jgi:hypothetical protein
LPAGGEPRALAEDFIRFTTAAAPLAAVANRIFDGLRASAMRRIGLNVDAGIPMRPHRPTPPRHLERALTRDDGC